ncbi:MAG: FHA domain-containing protein [Acidobacteriota bacterium]
MSQQRRAQQRLTRQRLTLATQSRRFEIEGAMIVGSDRDCDLRLEDAQVGGQHAEIYPVGTTWWIRDLGSDVGTYLNGEIVDAAPLQGSDEVQLGIDGPSVRFD